MQWRNIPVNLSFQVHFLSMNGDDVNALLKESKEKVLTVVNKLMARMEYTDSQEFLHEFNKNGENECIARL